MFQLTTQFLSLATILATILTCFTLTAKAQSLIPAAPELGATSWLLMDATTGKVLTSHQADEQIHEIPSCGHR